MTTTKVTVRGYTTHGKIRGCCGHLHPTRDEAEACLASDQRGCTRQSQRGYTDRYVVDVGSDGYLYHDIASDDWVHADGGAGCGAAKFPG